MICPESVQSYASVLTAQKLAEEVEVRGYMPPCQSLDPLSGGGYREEEYEAMERDEGKYFLYYGSIKAALLALVSDESFHLSDVMEIAIIGAGRGRLVEFCVDLCNELKINFRIVALDANEYAVGVLKERFKEQEHVFIESDPTILYPDVEYGELPASLSQNKFHLCVSELLGSFADNEFCPELQKMFSELLLKHNIGMQIPQKWSTFLTPVSCQSAWQFISTTGRSFESCYLMSLLPWPSSEALSDEQEAWSCEAGNAEHVTCCKINFAISRDCSLNKKWKASPSTSSKYQGMQGGKHNMKLLGKRKKISSSGKTGNPGRSVSVIHGFAGHFVSNLFGKIQADSRPWSEQRNTFHWESFFLPLETPITVNDIKHPDSSHQVTLELKRIYSPSNRALWYEWQVLASSSSANTPLSKVHNVDGKCQKWVLSL